MPSSVLDIPHWEPPKETTRQDIEWAELKTLDLSKVTGKDFTQVPQDVVKEIGDALHKDGFIYAENHGLSWENVLRQFDIGQFAFHAVSQEDKVKHRAKIIEEGSFNGYKPRELWTNNGVKDRIEHFNIQSPYFDEESFKKSFPAKVHPFYPEIAAFARYNHGVIIRKILTVLSLVLELPPDYLWQLAREPEKRGVDLLRYAMYHAPDPEDDKALGGVRLQGHTDFNMVSLLWSQPITSLEVLMPDNIWRLVQHRDNALVINIGDALSFKSGGYLKPTIHRVVAPPEDQAHYERNSIFYFGLFNADVSLTPIEESPVVQASAAKHNFWAENKKSGEPIPTQGQWEALRTAAYGQGLAKKGDDGHERETIAGTTVVHFNGETVQNQKQKRIGDLDIANLRISAAA
ncbi:unnamed protein product [Tilletia controversa]|uniref:Fe2OG dioxygenase domain-containing protein n=2 Tax=Tilletia TaxID=13289 RepID=A0A177VIA1_9BASI|nr:hypothetical protein CF336_g1024 [Tilletia laevis]KAE8264039.1 hypothetical protein A4X03_0g1236 [Tilletia caries]CAD6897787.1 unnamed protein product [Tilletia controversa]KAE8208069.1 hypothetical protein CF335_g684 [Tilletia laevis]CAD6887141.1 unnamed protein product [Tilletia caries]